MSIVDDKRPADELDGTRSLHAQFKDWRERDWFILGYPPQRPSAWWFSLATDAVWMVLLLMEQGLVLMLRMTVAMENLAVPGGGPKAKPLPVLPGAAPLPTLPEDE